MKLVCESLQELFESPDEVALPNLRYTKDGEPVDFDEDNPYVDSIDAHPFYLWEGEFILGRRGGVHPNGLRRAKAYPGRLWKDEKIMSFWEYPDKETFNKIIEQINQKLSDYYPDQKWDIMNDPDWMVEVIPVEDLGRGSNRWKQNEEYTAKLVSLKNYEGSEERSEKDLAKQHLTSPLLKAKHVPAGYGSKDPEYQAKRAWQMASLTSEGSET